MLLTVAELNQIDHAMDVVHREGIYWGNYDQFQKRTESIKKKIKDARDRINIEPQKIKT